MATRPLKPQTRSVLPVSQTADPKIPAAPALPASGTVENSASELIEAPQRPGRSKLDPHDFADGGGGGGAEAFSRKKTK